MTTIWSGTRLGRALLLGLIGAAVGASLSVSSWGRDIEERVGLHWLFQLRGPISPPSEVVLVAIDKASSDALGVPFDTTRWPRDLHTRLVAGLTRAGARSITFDLHFRLPRDDEDPAFAAALQRAGNVALLEFLEKDQPAAVADAERLVPIILQRRLPPAPRIAAVAAGTGPFTLPKVPDRVSRFWVFDENAGGVASLPLVALLLHVTSDAPGIGPVARRALPSPMTDLTRDDLSDWLSGLDIRDVSSRSPSPSQNGRAAPLEALKRALTPPSSRYLNFFGPARTIPTVTYADALRRLASSEGRATFAGKAVFVGVSSPVQWQLLDEFRTVYSDPVTGMDLSGSEILATAFANLRLGNTLQPLDGWQRVGVVMVWGLLVGSLVLMLRPWLAGTLLLILSLGYLWFALWLFSAHFYWLPVFIPLVIVGPLLLVASLWWQHREARADLSRIEAVFGQYLPQSTVRQLVRERHHPDVDRQTVFGVCLLTDAEGYTQVAERMASSDLVDLVNDYLAVIIQQIRRHGGEISDIKGDSVMAFWASRQDDHAIREAACLALIDIQEAIAQWNTENDHGVRLPTRCGLHCGSMTLASVGAADHYERRAVGDIVNTASRLEQLGKELGTRMLVSAQTVAGLDDFVTRPIDRFVLKGRSEPIDVYELLGQGAAARRQYTDVLSVFEAGRLAFERHQWRAAQDAFEQVLTARPQDRVANWFRDRAVRERQG